MLKLTIFVSSRPWSQNVHEKGQPLAVSNDGIYFPSKNLSNKPVRYGEGTQSLPSIWVGKDSKSTVISELVDEFNAANSGSIKVVIEEQTDYDIYAQKLTAQISTGDLPDIFTVGADLLEIGRASCRERV